MLCQAVAMGEQCHSTYLWGQAATGKSHLLQAVCDLACRSGLMVCYIPLLKYASLSSEILDGLDGIDIACLDDIDAIVGEATWELALFNLYNRLRDQPGSLFMTGSKGCRDLAFQLPDLTSRVSWDLVYHIQPLSDVGKISLLQKKAQQRGFTIPQDVANYLLRYAKRDMPSLLGLLDIFDQATSINKRKLTVHFVRDLLLQES